MRALTLSVAWRAATTALALAAFAGEAHGARITLASLDRSWPGPTRSAAPSGARRPTPARSRSARWRGGWAATARRPTAASTRRSTPPLDAGRVGDRWADTPEAGTGCRDQVVTAPQHGGIITL
jgi:hypothetical protein